MTSRMGVTGVRRREEWTMMLKFGAQRRSNIGERLKMKSPDRKLWEQC